MHSLFDIFAALTWPYIQFDFHWIWVRSVRSRVCCRRETAAEVKTATSAVWLASEIASYGWSDEVELWWSLTTSVSNTLQWVELIGMPTFDATSTVSALITSMQNPLWRQMSGEKDGEGRKTVENMRDRRDRGRRLVSTGGGGGGLLAHSTHSKPCQSCRAKWRSWWERNRMRDSAEKKAGAGPIRLPACIRCSCKQQGRGALHCCPGPSAGGWTRVSDCLFPHWKI